MSYDIYENPTDKSVVTSLSNWKGAYKEASLNRAHDQSELNLILPDDCLVVIGAPRLADVKEGELYVVGYLRSIQYTAERQVQPLKTIGSRRHIFAATNAPVSVQIDRIMFVGDNLLHALHKNQDIPGGISGNSKYDAGKFGVPDGPDSGSDENWFTNVEEDLYRIPFGMGVIYNSPSTMHSSGAGRVGEYFEGCTMTGHSVQIQAGESSVFEQMTLMADRVVGWQTGGSGGGGDAVSAALCDIAGGILV